VPDKEFDGTVPVPVPGTVKVKERKIKKSLSIVVSNREKWYIINMKIK
jgi:hypothetical protein